MFSPLKIPSILESQNVVKSRGEQQVSLGWKMHIRS